MNTTVDGRLIRSVATFPTDAVEEFVVSDHFEESNASARVTFGLGLNFEDYCLDVTERDVAPGRIELVAFPKLLELNEARSLLAHRWQPVFLSAIYQLLHVVEAVAAFRAVSTTYFPFRRKGYDGIVFVTELRLNNWHIDTARSEEMEGIAALDVDCQFGIPAP